MSKLDRWKTWCAVSLLCATTAIALPAQTFTTLHSFDNTDGGYPLGGLVQATDGNLYGTTTGGGANGYGTIFKVTPTGALTLLYSFCSQGGCADGDDPAAGLVQGHDGNFYGTAYFGGANGGGTVFRVTRGGTLTTLYSFCSQSNCADGKGAIGLTQGDDGNFYGTTYLGGSSTSCAEAGCGTLFKITPAGTLTTLYSFCSQTGCTDGSYPAAVLVKTTEGNFYGTTPYGGANGDGTIFKVTPTGTLTTLHSFDYTDGQAPLGGLVHAIDGNFYGTTFDGGASREGTAFKMAPTGVLTTLYSFCPEPGCPHGRSPQAGLVEGTDGNLYGTTSAGGATNYGTAFKITRSGSLTTLHSFCSRGRCLDGESPEAALIQDTNGRFYGTTYDGGTSDYGTIFSLSVGLRAFVEIQPAFGKVATAVIILGTNLTGTTSVTFNGAAAAFRVVSKSAISTTVPAGATTGKVQVVTPGGTLSSNVPFRVAP